MTMMNRRRVYKRESIVHVTLNGIYYAPKQLTNACVGESYDCVWTSKGLEVYVSGKPEVWSPCESLQKPLSKKQDKNIKTLIDVVEDFYTTFPDDASNTCRGVLTFTTIGEAIDAVKLFAETTSKFNKEIWKFAGWGKIRSTKTLECVAEYVPDFLKP